MTDFNMNNFNKFFVDEEKIDSAKQNARVKTIIDTFVLTVDMAIGDEYLMTPIPETAIILDAYIRVPVSLGTSGKIDMGLKAHVDRAGASVAEDLDSLVFDADAGGQKVLKRADLNSAGLLTEIGKGGAQPFLRASEASDSGVGDTIQAIVVYSLP